MERGISSPLASENVSKNTGVYISRVYLTRLNWKQMRKKIYLYNFEGYKKQQFLEDQELRVNQISMPQKNKN